MSSATLLCWQAGHGLSLETRGGFYEVLALRDGTTRRLVNACHVDEWPDNSRTAKRLEELYQKFHTDLVEMNARSHDTDPTQYRALYWNIRNALRAE